MKSAIHLDKVKLLKYYTCYFVFLFCIVIDQEHSQTQSLSDIA